MLKKKKFGMMTIIIGVMLIFCFAACSYSEDPSVGGEGNGSGDTGGNDVDLDGDGIITYTLTFDINGATDGTAPDPWTVQHNSQIYLPNNGFSREGYIFCTWSLSPDGTDASKIITRPDNFRYAYTEDITLYAQWFALGTYTRPWNGGTDNWTFNADGSCRRWTYTNVTSQTLSSSGTFTVSGITITANIDMLGIPATEQITIYGSNGLTYKGNLFTRN